MEDEAHVEGAPEAFEMFLSDLEKMGLLAKQLKSLMPLIAKQNPSLQAKSRICPCSAK